MHAMLQAGAHTPHVTHVSVTAKDTTALHSPVAAL